MAPVNGLQLQDIIPDIELYLESLDGNIFTVYCLDISILSFFIVMMCYIHSIFTLISPFLVLQYRTLECQLKAMTSMISQIQLIQQITRFRVWMKRKIRHLGGSPTGGSGY